MTVVNGRNLRQKAEMRSRLIAAVGYSRGKLTREVYVQSYEKG